MNILLVFIDVFLFLVLEEEILALRKSSDLPILDSEAHFRGNLSISTKNGLVSDSANPILHLAQIGCRINNEKKGLVKSVVFEALRNAYLKGVLFSFLV